MDATHSGTLACRPLCCLPFGLRLMFYPLSNNVHKHLVNTKAQATKYSTNDLSMIQLKYGWWCKEFRLFAFS